MGSLAVLAGSSGIPEAVENVLPFVDEIDGNALSEALMCPKPAVNPDPHTFWHEGYPCISMDGKIQREWVYFTDR